MGAIKLPVLVRASVSARDLCRIPNGPVTMEAILRGIAATEPQAAHLRTTGLDRFLPLLGATAEGLIRMDAYLGQVVAGPEVSQPPAPELTLPRWGGLDPAELGGLLMGEGLSGDHDWRASCGTSERHLQFHLQVTRSDRVTALGAGAGLSISHIGILNFYQNFWFQPDGTFRSASPFYS